MTTLLLVLAATVGTTSEAASQAVSSAAVTGIVRSATLEPIARARVTLSPPGSEPAYETTTSLSGAFAFSIVRPGSWDVRVEAIGFRPLLATGLDLGEGSSRNLTFTLTAEPPPVTRVDTLVLASAPVQSAGGRPGERRLGELEVGAVPHRFGDLASVVGTSTYFDDALGGLGLPGDRTLIVADGVPFYTAAHPVVHADRVPLPLFSNSVVERATVLLDGGSMEMPGASGPVVSIGTLTPVASSAGAVGGFFSNDAGWSSSRQTFDAPGLTSWQGDAQAHVSVTPTSRLVIAGSAMSQETPLPPRIDETTAASLALDAGLVADLSEPTVERYSRYSSLIRFDAQQGPRGQFFGRLAGSWVGRDFDALGAPEAPGAAAIAEESLDFSAAFGHTSQVGPELQSDVRLGISGSRRDFTDGADGLAPATLVSTAAPLGAPSAAAGMSNRLDFILIPSLTLQQANATLRGGVSIRLSKHEMQQGDGDLRSRFYSDAAALDAGHGYAMEETIPGTSFGTREYSAFATYENRVSDRLSVILGARFDHEALGGPGGMENDVWLAATGLSTAAYKPSFNQIGVRGLLVWQPVPGGNTSVTMSASLRDGDLDPRVVHAFYSGSGGATSSHYLGAGLDWPDSTIPTTPDDPLTTLSLLGPDTRAPRTAVSAIHLRQTLASTTAITIGGTYRRTDFLMRRRNLNLPVSPAATDPSGRPVWGDLTQDGSILATMDPGGRRFGEFGRVTALDPSGWSEYVGATVSLVHTQNALSTAASYTWSETMDNWLGARSESLDARMPSMLTTDADAPDWSEGVSDFDATHRASVATMLRFEPVSIGALYRFRSGLPFTPGYRAGVDANGDGSALNDVAPIPDAGSLGALASEWACLEQDETFAVRNGCRGPSSHSLDLRLAFDLSGLLGRPASLAVEALDVVERRDGVVDRALLLVDPTGTITTSPDGSTVTIPTIVNDSFGTILYPTSRGRMIRIGMRIGA